jgi:hypothetical protein
MLLVGNMDDGFVVQDSKEGDAESIFSDRPVE